MPVPGLDAERCRQRNQRAARAGHHAIPLRLAAGPAPGPAPAEGAAGPPADATLAVPPPGHLGSPKLVRSIGTLPANEAAALRQINAGLGRDGDGALTAEAVHLLPVIEAGNTNYVASYYLFLGESTLRNVAAWGARGFAVMNSHRTGGMSTPTELPYGWTYAGRYEDWQGADGARFRRALVAGYMLRGVAPNGANGPGTDDLAAMIAGGTVRDVSLGLRGGYDTCDVCGEVMDELDPETGRYLCPHMPGTHYKMTPEEVAAQQARGVADGVATTTYHDAQPGEVSPVYDGAVPGAGFSKALALCAAGRLPDDALAEAFAAYRPFWSRADARRYFPGTADGAGRRRPRRGAAPMNLDRLFSLWNRQGRPDVDVPEEIAAELAAGLDAGDDDAPPARITQRAKFSAGRIQPPPAPPAELPAPAPVDLSPGARKLFDDLQAQLAAAREREAAAAERERQAEERRAAEAEAARAADADRDSAAFADDLVARRLATPGQRDHAARALRLAIEAEHRLAGCEPYAALAAAGKGLAESLRLALSEGPEHGLGQVHVTGDGKKPLTRPAPGTADLDHGGTAPDPNAPLSEDRREYLLGLVPEGQAILAARRQPAGAGR